MLKRRGERRRGQALVEYAFLFVLLASITIAVVVMAGNQLQSTYNALSYDLTHLGQSCPTGQTPVLQEHKWVCQ